MNRHPCKGREINKLPDSGGKGKHFIKWGEVKELSTFYTQS